MMKKVLADYTDYQWKKYFKGFFHAKSLSVSQRFFLLNTDDADLTNFHRCFLCMLFVKNKTLADFADFEMGKRMIESSLQP